MNLEIYSQKTHKLKKNLKRKITNYLESNKKFHNRIFEHNESCAKEFKTSLSAFIKKYQ